MIIWALLAFLLVDFAITSPVREHNGDGYNYDVKHPKGSSRVHVRTGGDRGRNHYSNKAGSFPSEDYTSAESYVNPHYVGPSYQPVGHGYSSNYHQEPLRKAPVYEEQWRPNPYRQTPSYQQFPAHNRGSYGFHPNEHVSQTAVEAGPFYDQAYSNPHHVQQVAIDEPILDYQTKILEQSPVELVQQQVAVDEPILDYQPKKLEQSSVELVDQSPIDQQVFIEEPEEIPVILQKPLEQKPVLSQVIEDVPSVKTVPVEAPIVQQATLEEKINVPSVKTVPVEAPIVQQATLEEKISQITVEQKPSYDELPIVQQVSDGIPDHHIKQSSFDDTDKIVPVVQTAISEHPSQAIYDSSFEPSFSDIDRHRPSYSHTTQPRYQFIPVGRPYQKISHSTEIIHGPPNSYYQPRTFPRKYIKNRYPVVKNPPISYPVKYSPPPLPITKTLSPISPKYAQVHTDKRIFRKYPPAYQSVKRPPPPVHSVKLPPPPPYHSVKLPPPPPVHAVKLPPPPPPPVHSVKLPPPQVHSVKLPPPPPVYSVKLPPPPPVHSVKLPPPSVHSVKLPPPPPVHSVKLPPPPPVHSVKIPPPPVHSVKLPPPPPVHSVKLPPPPPPVTKTIIPVDLSQQQEHVDTGIVLEKAPPSVKLPPPAPVTKKVVPVDLSQQQEHVDIILEKKPPSVKLPPPAPVTKTVVPIDLSQQQEYVDAAILENPKPLYDNQQVHLEVPSVKIPPKPHSVKYPDISGVKHPKSVTGSGPSHINPHFSALSDIHDSKSIPLAYGDDQPHSDFAYYDTEDLPPKYPLQGAPPKKYSPTAHGPKDSYSVYEDGRNSNIPPATVHFDEPVNEKSPFDKYPPVSHAVRLPSVIPTPNLNSHTDSNIKPSTLDIDKPSTSDNHPPVSHAFRLPTLTNLPKTTQVPNLFKAVPSLPTDSNEDDGTELLPPKSEALVSPISHSVRLPIIRENSNKPKQDFPAFPVESAYKQRDPVSEKVAELTNSFTPGEGYDRERRPDENDSDSPSIEEAKAEIERLNEEIGIPFGDRLRRSRYSRSRYS